MRDDGEDVCLRRVVRDVWREVPGQREGGVTTDDGIVDGGYVCGCSTVAAG